MPFCLVINNTKSHQRAQLLRTSHTCHIALSGQVLWCPVLPSRCLTHVSCISGAEHHLAQLADKDSILHHVEQQLSRLQQQFAAWQPCDDNEGCHPRWHTWAGGEDVDDDQESLSPDR